MRSLRFSSGLSVVTSTSLPVDTVKNLAANQAQGWLECIEKRFKQRGLAAAAFAGNAVDFVFLNLSGPHR